MKLKNLLIANPLGVIIFLSLSNLATAQETNEKFRWPYDVLTKIDQRAAKYKSGNCLELNEYNYDEKTFTKLSDKVWDYDKNLGSYYVSKEEEHGFVTNTLKGNYYKNICKFPLLIKGVKKEMILGKEGQRLFSDVSFVLSPGDSILFEKSEINDTYKNDIYEAMGSVEEFQYFLNTGLKKSPEIKIIVNQKKINNNKNSNSSIKKINAKKLSFSKYEIDSYTNTTDIIIKKGNKINITASGNVTYGVWAGSGGPEGIDGYTSYNRIEGFRHGSLLFRIGDGAWEAVGKSKFVIAKNNGVLQFIVNDDDPSNNGGSYIVDLKLTK